MATTKKSDGAERRKAKRRPIVETFSFFVVVPKKGFHRLRVADVSDSGIGFDFDIGGENAADFPVKGGELFDLQLYLNQSLFLPFQVRVMRIDEASDIRRIGAQFVDPAAKEVKALKSVLAMVDEISEVVQFTT